MEEVHDLLKQFGLPALAIPIVIIGMGIALFFVKRTLKVRDEREKNRHDTLHVYAALQEEALFQAYRTLYEGVNLSALAPKDLVHLVEQADALIMGPFTRYRIHLDDRLQARVFDLHNIIAQYRPDPKFPRNVTPEAIDELLGYREHFLKDIESISDMLRKYS
jgi:hypothetical protein